MKRSRAFTLQAMNGQKVEKMHEPANTSAATASIGSGSRRMCTCSAIAVSAPSADSSCGT